MTTTASPSALTVTGLRKSFGEKTVLDATSTSRGDDLLAPRPERRRRIPGGHAWLSFHDLDGLNVAAEMLGKVSRDGDPLVLQVPSDGTPKSLAALVDRLDHYAVPVERVTVQTADLDDVFFALTGHPHAGQDNRS